MSKRHTGGVQFKLISSRAIVSRENGRYGGEARAAKYEPSILSEWASRGGNAILEKYGPE